MRLLRGAMPGVGKAATTSGATLVFGAGTLRLPRGARGAGAGPKGRELYDAASAHLGLGADEILLVKDGAEVARASEDEVRGRVHVVVRTSAQTRLPCRVRVGAGSGGVVDGPRVRAGAPVRELQKALHRARLAPSRCLSWREVHVVAGGRSLPPHRCVGDFLGSAPVLRVLRRVDASRDVDMILHVPGGQTMRVPVAVGVRGAPVSTVRSLQSHGILPDAARFPCHLVLRSGAACAQLSPSDALSDLNVHLGAEDAVHAYLVPLNAALCERPRCPAAARSAVAQFYGEAAPPRARKRAPLKAVAANVPRGTPAKPRRGMPLATADDRRTPRPVRKAAPGKRRKKLKRAFGGLRRGFL